jgi:hypothetical protein
LAEILLGGQNGRFVDRVADDRWFMDGVADIRVSARNFFWAIFEKEKN